MEKEEDKIHELLIALIEPNEMDTEIINKSLSEYGLTVFLGKYTFLSISDAVKEKIEALQCILSMRGEEDGKSGI